MVPSPSKAMSPEKTNPGARTGSSKRVGAAGIGTNKKTPVTRSSSTRTPSVTNVTRNRASSVTRQGEYFAK